MLRVLVRPRWLALALIVVLVVIACVQLGRWQLHRYEQRRAAAALVERNVDRPPVPVDEVLAVGRGPDRTERWRTVTARGRYDAERELLVRNRPLDGPGFEVLTPLVTDSGVALLVDRGFVRAGADARSRPAVPPPPAGPVTLTGRVQRSETRGAAAFGTGLPSGQVGRIDVAALADRLPYPVYGGYVDLVEQQPAARQAPRPLPLPEPSLGPHLAYALQWWAFGAVAVVGFVLLARREAEDEREGGSPPVGIAQAPPRVGLPRT